MNKIYLLLQQKKKTDLKSAGVDTSKFSKKIDLAKLKSDVVKLDIDKLKNVPNNLSKLKNRLNKLDFDKLVLAPVDLSKLSDAVINDPVKNDLYNTKIEFKRPYITNLVTNNTLNAKMNEVKKETASFNNLATTTAFTAVENKMSNVSNLFKKTDYATEVSEIENKITTDHDHNKYFTTQDYNKVTLAIFTARLALAYLASKSDIANFVKNTGLDDKLKISNKN